MRRPERLDSPEAESRREKIIGYLDLAAEMISQQRAPIDHSFLLHREIAEALANAFNRACAYCESPFVASSGNVSHHRPLGLAADRDGNTSVVHYCWLAYEWENLYFVCDRCSRSKANRFFVKHERGRPGASIGELREIEGELILDPCYHNPGEHLHFPPDGRVEGRTALGQATIEVLDLNRAGLIEARANAYHNTALDLIVGNPLTVVSTGASEPLAAEVLADAEFDERPYRGATSLALLALADDRRKRRRTGRTLAKLIEELRSLDPTAMARFVRGFGSPSAAEEKREQDSPKKPAVKRQAESARARSRRLGKPLQLSDLPAAEAPIAHIAISNFRALQEIEFALPASTDASEQVPCMLLLGENAVGKSSILEALSLALLGSEHAAELDRLIADDEVTPRDTIHRPDPTDWDATAKRPIAIEIGYHDTEHITRLTGGAQATKFAGARSPAKILLAYGPRRFFSRKKGRRLHGPAHRVHSLFDPIATIANPIDWLLKCKSVQFDAAVRALRAILMLGPDAYFERWKDRIIIETDSGRVPLSEMSVGYKSVIALATDIIRELMHYYDNIEFAHAVVVIDEVETHLHPRWKLRIVQLLREAFPKVQFIITTHDPLCVRGMYPGEIFVLQRRESDRRIVKLDDLPDVRGMRAEQILTSEFFGLGSTDPETELKLAKYHRLAARDDRNATEDDEMQRLRDELERTIKVGDTIQEQAFAEAMRRADLDRVAVPGRVTGKSRVEMVESLQKAAAEMWSNLD